MHFLKVVSWFDDNNSGFLKHYKRRKKEMHSFYFTAKYNNNSFIIIFSIVLYMIRQLEQYIEFLSLTFNLPLSCILLHVSFEALAKWANLLASIQRL